MTGKREYEERSFDIKKAVAVGKDLAEILDEMRKKYGGVETYIGLRAFMATFYEQTADYLDPNTARKLDSIAEELGRSMIEFVNKHRKDLGLD
jgi:hypothetical protein